MAVDIDEILALPLEERIAIAERLCESLADQPAPPLSEEHLAILRRYLDEYRANPDDTIPWETVRDSVFARY